MRLLSFIYTFIVAGAIWMQSCKKLEHYSEIPNVNFNEVSIDGDSTKLLVFNFIDGDGDLYWTDTSVQHLFLTFIDIKQGDKIKHEFADESQLPRQFPSIPTPTGNNKTVKGIMEIDLENICIPYNLDALYNVPDTFYIKFSIMDNAGHFSNIDSSNLLTITKQLQIIDDSTSGIVYSLQNLIEK